MTLLHFHGELSQSSFGLTSAQRMNTCDFKDVNLTYVM